MATRVSYTVELKMKAIEMRLAEVRLWISVKGQKHNPIESRYFSGFFMLSVQVRVPSQGRELVPIAEKDKNIVRLPISWISKQ